ncbi:hypothetical protein F0562_036069 [Nyssa sinensis]|uniref:DUF4219 domain-containing protein n=1 Tax=Nyssa sinensis TaxID=561372 RepID=A0A5J5AEP5_9ASTE|nr:hypothetical protein F0562_036069 [Nyssa sinensis]
MTSNVFSPIIPPVFTGENYQTWAVRMTAYLQVVDLWEAVEADYEIAPLLGSLTMQAIKIHNERMNKKFKAKSCLYSIVSEALFTKIMTLESAKDIWDYQGADLLISRRATLTCASHYVFNESIDGNTPELQHEGLKWREALTKLYQRDGMRWFGFKVGSREVACWF